MIASDTASFDGQTWTLSRVLTLYVGVKPHKEEEEKTLAGNEPLNCVELVN